MVTSDLASIHLLLKVYLAVIALRLRFSEGSTMHKGGAGLASSSAEVVIWSSPESHHPMLSTMWSSRPLHTAE